MTQPADQASAGDINAMAGMTVGKAIAKVIAEAIFQDKKYPPFIHFDRQALEVLLEKTIMMAKENR